MLQQKDNPILGLALILALATASEPFAAFLVSHPALAQSPSPTALPVDVAPQKGQIQVDGSSSMALINQALEKAYGEKFPGANIGLAESGTDAALKSLLNGTIDLAAIGRPLTQAEKDQGLKERRLTRSKIAIIIGSENSFNGDLTFEQFAKIFRGEITDWAEVGGRPGSIKFVDRPEFSDTRKAFSNYPVFQKAPFVAGSTAKTVDKDSTEAVIKELGKDGISFAIADQVLDRKEVKIVPMHKTLPTDPRYPYSQFLGYAYKGTPTPAVLKFLDFAATPENQALIEKARIAGAIATFAGTSDTAKVAGTSDTAKAATPSPVASPSSAAVVSPSPTSPTVAAAPTKTGDTADAGGLPLWLWWLLPLALLAPLLWWWLKNRQAGAALPTPAAGGIAAGVDAAIPSKGAGELTASPAATLPDGAIAGSGAALPDATLPGGAIAGAALAAGAGAAALAGLGGKAAPAGSTITLTALDRAQAKAVWETPDAHKAALRNQGGKSLKLRLYDVTGIDQTQPDLSTYQEFDITETATTQNLPIPSSDRDYLAEVGYETGDERWLPLARSNSVRVAAMPAVDSAGGGGFVGGAIAGAALATGAGVAALASFGNSDDQSAIEASKYNVGQTDLSSESLATVDEGLPDLPQGYGESRIVLMPRDPQWGYAYWDAPDEHKQALRQQGGQKLALRLYDVTDIDLSTQSSHSLQQYDCDELARDWYVPIPVSDRDYIAEIGYLTGDGRWLLLARSNPVRIPPVYPSDWFEDQFITISWDEELRGKTFVELLPPGKQPAPGSAIYDQIFGMAQSAEAMRVAGSLFGSMQQVPEQAVSSYVFPSGVGMWALPTMSGLTMSGVGFSASMPPIRVRKFWLIADAELIVYGATEPDATVYVNGVPIQLNPDGTFRFQMSFQDGVIDFPIVAVAADGEQTRAIQMTFTRETPERRTNTKDEAIDEWLF